MSNVPCSRLLLPFPNTRLWIGVSFALTATISGCARSEEFDVQVLEEYKSLVIGGTHDTSLTRVSSIALGPDGLLAIAQPDESTVKIFDSTGALIRQVGQQGVGPGDFQSPRIIGWRDTLLWVRDDPLRRISFFSYGDDYVAELRIPSGVLGGGRYVIQAAVPWVDTSLGAVASFISPAQRESRHHSIPLLRLDLDPFVVDTIAYLHASGPFQYSFDTTNGRLSGRQPISDMTIWDFDPRFARALLLDRLVDHPRASSGVYLTAVGPAGDTLWSRGLPYDHLRHPYTQRRQLIAQYAALLNLPPRVVSDELWLPRHRPAVTAMLAGEGGHIWIRIASLSTDERIWWDRLTPEGHLSESFALPVGESIRYATPSAIWTARDAGLDGFIVTKYDLPNPR